jgi:hypothetical protein
MRLVKLLEVADMATEGRSGVAAEDQRQRSVAHEGTEPDAASAIQTEQLKRRHGVARLEAVWPPVLREGAGDQLALTRVGLSVHHCLVARVERDLPSSAVSILHYQSPSLT